jgi:ribosomal protein S12 methylthiotransferase
MDEDPELHVPDEIKVEREAELMLAQQEVAFDQAKYLAEQAVQFDVLIDGPAAGRTKGRKTAGVTAGGSLFTGRAYFQAPQIDSLTYVMSREALAPGSLVRCTVVDADGYDLIAQPTDELGTKATLPIVR